MDKHIRLVMKQLGNQQNVEENLSKYADFMSGTYMEYSLIQLAMNLYTFKERSQEYVSQDPYVEKALYLIQKYTGFYVLDHKYEGRDKDLKEIHEVRDKITARMRILTSYTDALQIYEYILNRMEYTYDNVPDLNAAIDPGEYGERLFQYIFADNDKMVVNSKIQMMVAQLPVRITKNRFYDILNESLKIYTGSEKITVDDFAETIRACSGLYRPEGFESEYPYLYDTLQTYEKLIFTELDQEQWQICSDKLKEAADYIENIVTDYLMLEDIVNDLYAVMASCIYVKNETKEMGYAVRILECVLESMANDTPMDEMAEDCFFALEGTPERLSDEMIQGEGILFDVWAMHQERLKENGLLAQYADLNLISKLLCNSVFIDLKPDALEPEIADADYIQKVLNQLINEFSASFMTNPKMINRARMAMVLGNVPVFFNSQDEIKEYLNYALVHCNNDSELRAVVSILDEMMEE